MPQDATSTGLMMAWKGVEDDSGIYLSTKGFGDWSPQRRIDGVGTSNRPALCNFGSMRMVWTGIEDDSGIYFSLFDGNEFTGQVRVNNVGTSRVPSVFTVGASPT